MLGLGILTIGSLFLNTNLGFKSIDLARMMGNFCSRMERSKSQLPRFATPSVFSVPYEGVRIQNPLRQVGCW
jgi:hypothetical protein